MNEAKIVGILMLVFGFLSLGFNNCSQVDFKQDPSKLVSSGTTDEPSIGTDLSDAEVVDVIDLLPPGHADTQHPVTDLEKDPTLYDLYGCADRGVVICHFPNAVTAQHTQCVGRQAVQTHFDHVRSYNSPTTGEPKSISDYLGPCRFPL